MMNSLRRISKDVISIFTSVLNTGKLTIRTIAPKGALTCSSARPVIISTIQFGRTATVRNSDMVSLTVFHDSLQIIGMA
ncbi:hypothetical protein SAMN05660816_06772 [Niastella yeongjuensis]|nr:hypothetical protein SAMN05660816_06772 [Niastella yeongjuensis]